MFQAVRAPRTSGRRALGARVTLGTLATLLALAAAPATAGSTSGDDRSSPRDTSSAGTSPRADVQPPSQLEGAAPGELRVIVRSRPGRTNEAREAVEAAGGRVLRRLPMVDSVVATAPPAALSTVSASPAVMSVSPDAAMVLQGGGSAADDGSAYHRVVKADDAAAAGLTGRGTTVALVDTGVADVPELAGRIVPVTDDLTGRQDACKNFSGESDCNDSYGHGTFMAGLIAGRSAGGAGPGGVAPDARILSVKVAGRDGATDVSTVLAAIQWVVSFKDRYGIDVLNLSLGTDSTQSYRVDPLNYAVERAWDAGIVVVVSAANLGPSPGTVTKPGDDPFVITVGSIDDRATPGTGDDRLPDFSSRGPTRDGMTKPDIVAPGARVASLRSPGSRIDEDYPPPGDGPYRRGSGTSMSAAIVSGVAALVRQSRPEAGPDEIKQAIRTTARPVASTDPNAVGSGLVDAHAAATGPGGGRANAGLARSNGLGALGGSRGSRGSLQLSLDALPGQVLGGLLTAQLLLWDPLGYTTRSWSPATWYTSVHGLARWQNVGWQEGHNWGGHNWGGSSWYGSRYDGDAYGRPGPASAWYGAWD